jgi:hypothetical protein
MKKINLKYLHWCEFKDLDAIFVSTLMLFQKWSSALRYACTPELVVATMETITYKQKNIFCNEFGKSTPGRHLLYQDHLIEAVIWKIKPSGWISNFTTNQNTYCAWLVLDGSLLEYRKNWLHIHKDTCGVQLHNNSCNQSNIMNPSLTSTLSLHVYFRK